MAASLTASSFVVPNDRDFLLRSEVVALGSPLHSYIRLTSSGLVQTVTMFSVEEAIKGDVGAQTIDIIEPGGTFEDRVQIIPGVPRFADGQRYLLFLTRGAEGWQVRDLALGKFSFSNDVNGRDLLVRDEEEISGWDGDGRPHVEPHRDAALFLAYLRRLINGRGPVREPVGNYVQPKEPLVPIDSAAPALAGVAPMAAVLAPQPLAVYSATSYTFLLNGSLGGRWNVFPSPVTFYSVGTEPGAPGGGTTAINAAFAAWNNDPNSNVNYVYAGQDLTGTHNGGVGASDGQNTIAFEQDLSAYGAGPFQCTANSYSGTLGLGGITRAVGTHVGPNGETFATALEGDVQMNKGLANCTLLFNNGDLNSALTHEVGHTLGFRHSDQTRADNSTACSTDPSLECATLAIMKSFVATGLNGTLQPYDVHAVDAVYPGATVAAPAAPTGVNARATNSTSVLITWNAATGATSYDIYRRAPGGTFILLGSTTTTSYTDNTAAANTAYLYRVSSVNAGGSTDSAADLATTVIFTDDPLVARSTLIKAVHLAELRTAVNAVRLLSGLAPATFTDAATRGVVVKAVHINELRAALDAAMGALGLPTGGWTDSLGPGVLIKAVHLQEVRNRVK